MDNDRSDDRGLRNDNKVGQADDPAPFERWLDRKLKTAYGSVLEEPIPQDLINLLKTRLDDNIS